MKYDADLGVVIDVEDFGRDHITTLMYLETRCVNYGGVINRQHMRGHLQRRPEQYPTRLADGVLLHKHDDFDCLDDYVRLGLAALDNERGRWSLTDEGWALAHRYRREKADRG